MYAYEKIVKNAVEAGEKIEYAVYPVYEKGAAIPKEIRLWAKGNKGFSLNVIIQNTP